MPLAWECGEAAFNDVNQHGLVHFWGSQFKQKETRGGTLYNLIKQAGLEDQWATPPSSNDCDFDF